ncbi:hypothetical protein NA898_01815 [Proteus cibi]|uniref:Uncharacterized protein n=1 Tax=Proteus cibi TaxID=2050966 RepID=A0ABU6ECB4_9GAMM|nr:hypothetical protein [Proteus cibi]MEB6856717.1 hypothetical protein [Proteus cibi]MEB7087290.1 hypothetical protein [Proteus cibi]
MKLSIYSLFFMIFIYGLFFSFLSLSGEWLLTDQSIHQLDWVNSIKLGGFIGCSVGTVVWIVMRFNIR